MPGGFAGARNVESAIADDESGWITDVFEAVQKSLEMRLPSRRRWGPEGWRQKGE